MPRMRFSSPIVLASLLLLACGDNGSESTTQQPGSTSTAPETTDQTPTSTTPDPTGSTGAPGTDTGDSTGAPATTTGEPQTSCVELADANACAGDDRCKWAKVFVYTHAGGCQGDVIDLCVEAQAGAPSTWYHGTDPDYQVVGFDYTPTDLPPDWKICDCDGPLACFCAALNAPDCPERHEEFCGVTNTELACNNALINGEFVCGWFRTKFQGPKDDACEPGAIQNKCLPASNAGSNECDPVAYQNTYPDECSKAIPPAYWREIDGQVEVTTSCGPVPPAPEWTLCDVVDTVDQPDECGCACALNP